MKKFYQWLKNIALSFKNNIEKLSFYEQVTLTISLVGALSLIFIFIQITQTTANMNASIYATMNIQTLEMDKIFLEHPDLRPYFYEKKDPSEIPKDDKHDDTLNRILIVAEYQLDFFDLVMTQLDYLPGDKDAEEDKANWQEYFVDSFVSSPALCKRIADRPGWYMKRLEKLSEEPCKKH